MNDHRQFRGAREFELLREDARLNVARRMIVVIIEAYFSPRHNARVAHQFRKSRQFRIARGICIVRMKSSGGENPIVLLGQSDRAANFIERRADANRQNRGHACRARAFQHGGAIAVKFRSVQVRV